MRVIICAACLLLLGGCFAPDYGDGGFACIEQECPDGYECIADTCMLPGSVTYPKCGVEQAISGANGSVGGVGGFDLALDPLGRPVVVYLNQQGKGEISHWTDKWNGEELPDVEGNRITAAVRNNELVVVFGTHDAKNKYPLYTTRNYQKPNETWSKPGPVLTTVSAFALSSMELTSNGVDVYLALTGREDKSAKHRGVALQLSSTGFKELCSKSSSLALRMGGARVGLGPAHMAWSISTPTAKPGEHRWQLKWSAAGQPCTAETEVAAKHQERLNDEIPMELAVEKSGRVHALYSQQEGPSTLVPAYGYWDADKSKPFHPEKRWEKTSLLLDSTDLAVDPAASRVYISYRDTSQAVKAMYGSGHNFTKIDVDTTAKGHATRLAVGPDGTAHVVFDEGSKLEYYCFKPSN